MTDCIGVTEKENGSSTFPSPISANVECYSDAWVNDSRFATIIALQELIREFGLDVTMTAMPVKRQTEAGGPDHPAWEVYIYSIETEKVLMLYLVKAETGFIKKMCDNRFEDQHCRKLGEG
ncbi:MAG: hypothetical protein AAFY56_17520 [Pseudomonadota bacterium]